MCQSMLGRQAHIGSSDRSISPLAEEYEISMESLILAQDERWRRA
jgi:hypothetical protein